MKSCYADASFSIHNDRAWVLYEPKAMLSFCTWEDWIDDISLYNKVQIYQSIKLLILSNCNNTEFVVYYMLKKISKNVYFEWTIDFDK